MVVPNRLLSCRSLVDGIQRQGDLMSFLCTTGTFTFVSSMHHSLKAFGAAVADTPVEALHGSFLAVLALPEPSGRTFR